MSVYRRGGIYWYEFEFAGSRIRESTRTNSKRVAKEAERKRRRDLELGINRIRKPTEMPLFKVAAQPSSKTKADDAREILVNSTSMRSNRLSRRSEASWFVTFHPKKFTRTKPGVWPPEYRPGQ